MAKVYTAQEMRDFAEAIAGDLCDNGHRSVAYTYGDLIPVIEALRQAADAIEELDELKNNHLKKVEAALRRANLIGMDCDREIARLKAQLADAMAREAREEYEYSLKGASGRVSYTRFPDVLTARSRAIYGDTVVRHKVGEWEEV